MNEVSKHTRIEYLRSEAQVNKSEDDNQVFYKEVNFYLANMNEALKVCYYEYTSLNKKECKITIISPSELSGETETFKNDTIDSAVHSCLNNIAYQVEIYCGTTLGCHSAFKEMLAPL